MNKEKDFFSINNLNLYHLPRLIIEFQRKGKNSHEPVMEKREKIE
jgi:hypothetical protein